jgi:sugar lactone lactonase YvrE
VAAVTSLVVADVDAAPPSVDVGLVETIATFDPSIGDTPESLVIDSCDNIYVSMALSGEIVKIDASGQQSTHAFLPVGSPFDVTTFSGIMGAMVIDKFDDIYVNVSAVDPLDRGVWVVHPDGSTALVANLPTTAVPNGIAKRGRTVYVADSAAAGKVWAVPLDEGEPYVWAEHPLLDSNPLVPFPGPNGVQIFRQELYVSNSNTAQIVAFPFPEGGEPRVVADVGCDDFAFDVKRNLYCGTDPFNTVLKISPEGAVETLLDANDGLDGPTAVLFGRFGVDRFKLYIANAAFPFFSSDPMPSLMRLSLEYRGGRR